jgi:hypothetical protein
LAIGGASLLVLGALFLWRELALDPEWMLALAAVAATGVGLKRTEAGVAALAGITLVAGGWFAGGALLGLVPEAFFHPVPLLIALALSLAGALAVLLTSWRDADDKLRETLIYTVVGIAMAASWAVYYQVFTVGIAAEEVARRMVLTLVWLAAGLALVLRDRPLRDGGRVLLLASFAKALFYDTTHLGGALRVALLLVCGGLFLGGAWALERRAA